MGLGSIYGRKEETEEAPDEDKPKNWIGKAIKKPGVFRESAKKAGRSITDFSREKEGPPGKLGRRARLALQTAKTNRG